MKKNTNNSLFNLYKDSFKYLEKKIPFVFVLLTSLKTKLIELKEHLLKTQDFILIGMLSFILLVISPVFSIIWLSFITFYLGFVKGLSWRIFLKVWMPTIFIWYLIFTTLLWNYTPIIIGSDSTAVLIKAFLSEDRLVSIFDSLCCQTILILNFISLKLGFTIYIPTIPEILFLLFKRVSSTGPSVAKMNNNSSERASKEPRTPSPKKDFSGSPAEADIPGTPSRSRSFPSNLFKTPSKSQTEKDLEPCASLGENLGKRWNPVFGTVKKENEDGSTSRAGYVNVPFLNIPKFTYCVTSKPTNKKSDSDSDSKKQKYKLYEKKYK